MNRPHLLITGKYYSEWSTAYRPFQGMFPAAVETEDFFTQGWFQIHPDSLPIKMSDLFPDRLTPIVETVARQQDFRIAWWKTLSKKILPALGELIMTDLKMGSIALLWLNCRIIRWTRNYETIAVPGRKIFILSITKWQRVLTN